MMRMMTKAKVMMMMMMMMMFMMLGVASAKVAKVPLGLKETKLSNVVLPKPMSDFSTVYDDSNNHLYISGGCDSIKGNEYNMEFGIFTCNNISNNHYMIDVDDIVAANTKSTVSFTPLADMPMARYRHTAVFLPSSQQILLIGGRNVIDDSILPTVDIYNIQNDTWTTHNITDPKYLLSDNTGLEYMNRAYIFGGYNGTYTTQSTSFYVTINDDSSLNFTDIAELPNPRGDISSVLYTSPSESETYALVTGGFTDSLCNALDTVEPYNFNTNEWESEKFDTLNTARADMVLVGTSHTSVLDDEAQTKQTQHLIYALGGERPIEKLCESFTNANITVEIGSETVPIDDIEYYNVMDNTWTTFPNSNIDVYRFRFSGVVDTQTNVIYTLGGQLAFNKSCTCFPTSNEIYMYTEIFQEDDATPPASSPSSNANGPHWSKTMKMTMMFTTVATIIAFIRF